MRCHRRSSALLSGMLWRFSPEVMLCGVKSTTSGSFLHPCMQRHAPTICRVYADAPWSADWGDCRQGRVQGPGCRGAGCCSALLGHILPRTCGDDTPGETFHPGTSFLVCREQMSLTGGLLSLKIQDALVIRSSSPWLRWCPFGTLIASLTLQSRYLVTSKRPNNILS